MSQTSDGFKAEFLPLEGCFNFRDLGGYPTASGRRVKTGMLFRSDALQLLTARDAIYVRESLGLATVIDFRNIHEVERDGRSNVAVPWVDYHNEPVLEGRAAIAATGEEDPAERLMDMYLWALRNGGTYYGAAFNVVAAKESLPAVFHCSAGKDRAGIFASLILGILGVESQTIIDDYMLTNEKVALIMQRLSERPGNEHMQTIPVDFFRAQAPAMEAVLGELRIAHGDAAGYLQTHGVEEATIAVFRQNLLE